MVRRLKKKNVLVLHVPRCGGTFFEAACRELRIPVSRWVKDKCSTTIPKKHALLQHFFPEAVAPIKHKVAFIRNIPDYYKSVWGWLKKTGPRNRQGLFDWKWHPFHSAARLWHPDFNLWAVRIAHREPAWATRMFEWYVGPEGGEFCRFIGRVETIKEDICQIGDALGMDTSLWLPKMQEMGKQNAFERKPEWEMRALDQVYRAERAGLERWTAYSEQRWFGGAGFE